MLIARFAIIQVAIVAQIHHPIEIRRGKLPRLCHKALCHFVVHFEQHHGLLIARHHQIAKMLCQTIDKELRIKSAFAYLFVDEQCRRYVALQERFIKAEIIVVVEHIEVFNRAFVGDIALARCRHLVENRQRIAHGAIGFLRYHIQRRHIRLHAAVGTDVFQLLHDVGHANARKIVDLAARQNGGDNFLLFCGSQNKNGIFGRLFQGFQKCIECRSGEHVHLIDDKHPIAPHLRRNAYLLHNGANIVNRVVAGGV